MNASIRDNATRLASVIEEVQKAKDISFEMRTRIPNQGGDLVQALVKLSRDHDKARDLMLQVSAVFGLTAKAVHDWDVKAARAHAEKALPLVRELIEWAEK